MKKTIIIFLEGMLLVALISCNKADGSVQPDTDPIDMPEPEPNPVNKAPGNFALLTPRIDSINVNRTPIFSWEQATDPDGDTVTYDLYLDTQENPSKLLVENLSTTSFELTENLDFDTQYYWKVVAKDDKDASTEIIQPLSITVPVKWLSRYDPNDEGGELEITYAQGILLSIGQDFTDYQNDPIKLERLRSINAVHEYQYTTTGKQREVYNGDGNVGERLTFEYDENDRVISINQEIRYDLGKGGIKIILNESALKYNNATDVHPFQIVATDKDVYRFTLKWEGGNIVEVLSEVDIKKGNGFEFEGLVKIEYDDNINPYYLILSNQFGILPFYYLTDSQTGLESLDFALFKWQSLNNINEYEVFDEPNSEEPVEGYRLNYVYSKDYYPLSASRYRIDAEGEGGTNQIIWSYLNE